MFLDRGGVIGVGGGYVGELLVPVARTICPPLEIVAIAVVRVVHG